MARPRRNDWLDDEMSGLRDARVDVLVSMLTPAEASELDREGEADAALGAGLDFVSCPRRDGKSPTLRSSEPLSIAWKRRWVRVSTSSTAGLV